MSTIQQIQQKPKILYALQGTGNGHVSRAREILPILMELAETDILVSGTEFDLQLPFPVKYYCSGLSFVFGKKGGIDYLKTFRKANIKRLIKDIKNLDVRKYDLVINDFEPVSAWACKLANIPCIGLSHQAAVNNPFSPKPKKADILGKAVLENYAPVSVQYGFHFEKYDDLTYTPVIRSEIRNVKATNRVHHTVYLPAFSDAKLIRTLKLLGNHHWEVFSKHCKKQRKEGNISLYPVNNDLFVKSLIDCKGIICGAGFETPAEALFLGKKLMVLPMKGQYEQHCNAAALKKIGISVLKNFKPKRATEIRQWLESEEIIKMDFPDETKQILSMILQRHARKFELAGKMKKAVIHSQTFYQRRRSLEKLMTAR